MLWVICVNNGAGNEIVSKIFGGTDMERPSTIVPLSEWLCCYGCQRVKGFLQKALLMAILTLALLCRMEEGYLSVI